MNFEFILRLVGGAVLASVGWWIGSELSSAAGNDALNSTVALALAGLALGLLLTPYLTTRPMAAALSTIRQVPAGHLLAGTVGLAIGLVIAAMLALPLSFLPRPLGSVLPLIAAIVCGYLGVAVMVMRERDLITALHSRLGRPEGRPYRRYVLLDTSVIIDGRIADISETGFIDATMLVPRFILNELQHIADSSDPLRRNRGRRGLDILNKLQKDQTTALEITDLDEPEFQQADAKLVAVGRRLNAAILTNDYNLNKVAELQGVRVLNINELANAVKTVVLPGESMRVNVIQEGKEADQGVGYLDDGTMVVIEDGRRFIGDELDVNVTRVLQTVAGRMIFAQPSEKERIR